MNTISWLVAGACIGWFTLAALGFNHARGVIMSMCIGAAGGMLGGNLAAPIFGVAPDAFSLPALGFAVFTAAAVLALGNLIHNLWGV